MNRSITCRQHRSLSSIGYDASDYPSATLHRAPHWLLTDRAATRAKSLVGVLVLFFSAHESFVGFD